MQLEFAFLLASMKRTLENEWPTGAQSEARTSLRDHVMKNKHSTLAK